MRLGYLYYRLIGKSISKTNMENNEQIRGEEQTPEEVNQSASIESLANTKVVVDRIENEFKNEVDLTDKEKYFIELKEKGECGITHIAKNRDDVANLVIETKDKFGNEYDVMCINDSFIKLRKKS